MPLSLFPVMSLLGTPLLVAVGLVAFAMPAVAVMLWARLPGPPPVRTFERLAVVALAQLVALTFGLVAVNDYGQFFNSWSDLLGRSQPAQFVALDHFGAPWVSASAPLGTVVQARAMPAGSLTPGDTVIGWGSRDVAPTAWSPRADWTTRGAVLRTRIDGPTSGLSEDALVYLPPSYFASRQRSMPVVEVLTGYPGGTNELVDRLHYPDALLATVRTHEAKPAVLVMLRPSVTYPRDTECTDVPDGPQAFTFFATDVPDVVKAEFGLSSAAFGAIGVSTGGMCAIKLAVTDPRRFTAAVALSGYFHAIKDFTTGNLYGNSVTVRDNNDIVWRLRHLAMPSTSVLVGTALDERGNDGYRAAQQFLHLVRAPMSADEMVLDHGGHNFRTWRREIPRALRWLSQHLAR